MKSYILVGNQTRERQGRGPWQYEIILFRFSTNTFIRFCGLWFQWQFNFHSFHENFIHLKFISHEWCCRERKPVPRLSSLISLFREKGISGLQRKSFLGRRTDFAWIFLSWNHMVTWLVRCQEPWVRWYLQSSCIWLDQAWSLEWSSAFPAVKLRGIDRESMKHKFPC